MSSSHASAPATRTDETGSGDLNKSFMHAISWYQRGTVGTAGLCACVAADGSAVTVRIACLTPFAPWPMPPRHTRPPTLPRPIAAAQDHATAIYRLAHAHCEGTDWTGRNEEEGLRLLRRAADLEHVEAMKDLGLA